jgi:hypothetical protein
MNEIWTSGVKYDTSNLVVSLYDLEDNGTYYARATGQTINGMDLETVYIFFSVNYVQPSVYAVVTLENIKNEGSIKIQSNIISLEAKYSGNDTVPYLNNDYVDLSNTNNYVYFDNGFSLDNDFSINIKGYGFKPYLDVLHLSNGEKTIVLKKKISVLASENDSQVAYYELVVPNALSNYIVHSNNISVFADVVSIWIQRVSNIYNVYVDVLTTSNEVDGGTPTSTDYILIDGGTPFTSDTLIISA